MSAGNDTVGDTVEATPDASNPDEYDCTCPHCGKNFTVELEGDQPKGPADDAGAADDSGGGDTGDDGNLDDAGGFSFARGR